MTHGLALLPEEVLTLGLLVAARVGGLLLFAPALGSKRVPAPAKLGLATAVAVVLYPVALDKAPSLPDPVSLEFGLLLLREVLIGAVLGYVSSLIVSAAQTAGAVLDLQSGLGAATMFDPVTGMNTPLISHAYYLIASVTFVTLDGHHTLLAALGRSWDLLPLGHAHISAATAKGLMVVSARLLWIAVQIAAPGMAAAFLTDLGLGLIARGVPQMNVFLVGLPAKLIVGLVVLAAAVPQAHATISAALGELARQLPWVLRGMAGG